MKLPVNFNFQGKCSATWDLEIGTWLYSLSLSLQHTHQTYTFFVYFNAIFFICRKLNSLQSHITTFPDYREESCQTTAQTNGQSINNLSACSKSLLLHYQHVSQHKAAKAHHEDGEKSTEFLQQIYLRTYQKKMARSLWGEGGWDEREKIQSHNYTTMEQYGGNENLTIIYDNGFQLIWCPTHSSPS